MHKNLVLNISLPIKNNNIDELTVENTQISFAKHPDKILDYVNECFTNIGSQLAKKVRQLITSILPEEKENMNQIDKLKLTDVTNTEIRNEIKNTNQE